MKKTIYLKPISINICWQGRRFRTPEYKKWQEAMHYLLLPKQKDLVRGNVSVFIDLYMPHPNKCDTDNFLKPILDSLTTSRIIEDDRRVYHLEANKHLNSEYKIKIRVEKI